MNHTHTAAVLEQGVKKREGIFNQIMVTNKFKFDTGMNVCIYKKFQDKANHTETQYNDRSNSLHTISPVMMVDLGL